MSVTSSEAPRVGSSGSTGVASLAERIANQANAQKSTGSRTPAGRAASAQNAVRHGLRAEAIVLPHAETIADWTNFRDAIGEALAPEGALEHELVDRVAVLLWRARRATRYETGVLAARQQDAEGGAVRTAQEEQTTLTLRTLDRLAGGGGDDDFDDEEDDDGPPRELARTLRNLEATQREASALGDLINRVRREPDSTSVPPREASELLESLCELAGLDPAADAGRFPGEPDVYWIEREGWTAGHLKAAAQTYASRRKT